MHNIDMTNGRANIAFRGSRQDIWHHLGTEMAQFSTINQWAKAAGLDWTAIKVPAIAALNGPEFDHLPAYGKNGELAPWQRFVEVKDRNFVVRSDNGHPLGYVSNIYQPVQPIDVLQWFEQYISVDDRFQLDVAGSLGQGQTIWATAAYREPLDVAGDAHAANLLMTTTLDGTASTINQGSVTRVVCQNTLHAALSDKRAVIRTRHNTKFDGAKVGKELAAIAQGFAVYKAMGDAMAATEMAASDVHAFFQKLLDIPRDAKRNDISPRKANQYDRVAQAYNTTRQEGAHGVWAALNAITRYVDHDRTNGSKPEAVMATSQFGAGAAMKAQAVELLLPLVKDRMLVPA